MIDHPRDKGVAMGDLDGTSTIERPDEEEAEEGLPQRARGNAPGERNCIACGTRFHSEGWHNRMCPQCRKRSAPFG